MSKQGNTQRGSVWLILGCMFASKTMTLIGYMEKHFYAKKRCIIIKHVVDNRYNHLVKNGGIVCNNLVEYNTIPSTITARLSDVDISNYDVIGVSESQFYDDLLVVDEWANMGKIVICDGLDGDYNRNNFGKIHLLMPKCEKIKKMNAVCADCGDSAAFTKKNIVEPGVDVVDIGAADKYRPVCRKCYFS